MNSVFISYRREGGAETAQLIHKELRDRNIKAFLDVMDLRSYHFDDRLLNEIENAPNFVLVLSPGSLEKCIDNEDWLRKEITHAIMTKRNIIPILKDNYRFPKKESLPNDIVELPRYNTVEYSHEYLDAVMNKIEAFIIKPNIPFMERVLNYIKKNSNIIKKILIAIAVLIAVLFIITVINKPPQGTVPQVQQQIRLLIIEPLDGSNVSNRTPIRISVPRDIKKIWVIVNPTDTNSYWVQKEATRLSSNELKVETNIGRPGAVDLGKTFKLMAVGNPQHQLHEGDMLETWPEAEWRSPVIKVRRQ